MHMGLATMSLYWPGVPFRTLIEATCDSFFGTTEKKKYEDIPLPYIRLRSLKFFDVAGRVCLIDD